jgi:hypothetical protein
MAGKSLKAALKIKESSVKSRSTGSLEELSSTQQPAIRQKPDVKHVSTIVINFVDISHFIISKIKLGLHW